MVCYYSVYIWYRNGDLLIMKAKDKKIDAKGVIAKARKAEKRNITYRIDAELLDRFTEALEDQGVSGNQVVETMIKDLVESLDQSKKR